MSTDRASLAFVGAGRLARALVPLLVEAGYEVKTVVSRRPGPARALARKLGRCRAVASLETAAEHAHILLLAVPDRAVEPTARALARLGQVDWKSRIVLHHAGALGADVLASLARRGAGTGVLHPLQSLFSAADARERLPESYARIEGDRRGAAGARRLARALGLTPLPSRRRLTAGSRAAYHAGASLVSNDLVALLDLAAQSLLPLGLTRQEAIRALIPLMRGTLDLVEARGPERGLSGPVVRADTATLKRQLDVLDSRSAEAAGVHRALSRRLVRLARAGGRLTPGEQRALLELLEQG